QCVGGVLTIIPSAIGQLTNLPGFLTSLIGIPFSLLHPSSLVSSLLSDVSGLVSGVTSVVGGLTSGVGSIVSEVTSVAGSVVSEVTSVAGSVVSDVTSVAGGVISRVESVLPSQVDSAVNQITSAAGAGASAAESVVTGVVGGATSAIGGVLSGIGLRERDQLYSPQQPFATPTGFASQPTSFYLSSSTTTAPPVITPTLAATARARPFGINRPIERHEAVQIAAYQGGMDPVMFGNLLKKHGFTVGEDVQVWRQKDEDMKMRKRSLIN
ncbi:hypothetical protein JCM11491_003506, partial [Sporobolomyces phaffii]